MDDGQGESRVDERTSAAGHFLRLSACAAASGFLVGLVWFGLFGRLAMRLLAFTSSVEVQGAFTDAGAEIGVITFDGTMGLLLFGAIPFGILGALFYAAIRPLLPTATGRRLLTCGVVGGVVSVVPVVNPDGRDFGLLEPTWLAVAVFVALGISGGVVLSLVTERLRPFFLTCTTGDGSLDFPRFLAFVPSVFLVVPPVAVALILVGGAYVGLAHLSPPRGLLPLARVVAVVALAMLAVSSLGRVGDIRQREPTRSDFVNPFEE